MTQPIYDALIIGGGLVGASAALALHQQGKNVALLEVRPPITDLPQLEQGWDARIFAISPANRQFLQSLNAWADEKRIQAVTRMAVAGDSGGYIEFNAADLHTPHLTHIAENRWLLAALWQQIAAHAIPVFQQTAIALHTNIQQATLTLADGSTLHSQLIIGADGAHSWVRQQAGINVREDAYGHHGVVANFHTELPHHNTAYQWFSHGEVLAYLPLPDHKISIVWSTAQPEALTQLSPEALAAAVSQRGHHVLGQLSPLSPAFSFNLILRRPASTVAQRILLIGDAAHTIHPLAGQGVNLGFGDVIELARLSQHASDLGAYQFLKRHAQNRLEPVRTMQLGCDGLFKLFQCQTPPAMAWLRNSGLNIINHLQPIKNQMIKHAMGL